MTKLEKNEKEIASLSPGDVATLAEWFADFHAELWDRQIEADAKAGTLDKLVEQTRDDHKA